MIYKIISKILKKLCKEMYIFFINTIYTLYIHNIYTYILYFINIYIFRCVLCARASVYT